MERPLIFVDKNLQAPSPVKESFGWQTVPDPTDYERRAYGPAMGNVFLHEPFQQAGDAMDTLWTWHRHPISQLEVGQQLLPTGLHAEYRLDSGHKVLDLAIV